MSATFIKHTGWLIGIVLWVSMLSCGRNAPDIKGRWLLTLTEDAEDGTVVITRAMVIDEGTMAAYNITVPKPAVTPTYGQDIRTAVERAMLTEAPQMTYHIATRGSTDNSIEIYAIDGLGYGTTTPTVYGPANQPVWVVNTDSLPQHISFSTEPDYPRSRGLPWERF